MRRCLTPLLAGGQLVRPVRTCLPCSNDGRRESSMCCWWAVLGLHPEALLPSSFGSWWTLFICRLGLRLLAHLGFQVVGILYHIFKTSYPHSFPRKSLPASHFQTCTIFPCDEPGSLYCLSDVTQERFLFQGILMGWKWGANGRDLLSCGFNRQASFCRWGDVHPVCCQKAKAAKSVLTDAWPLKRTP